MRPTPNGTLRGVLAAVVALALGTAPAAARSVDVEIWTDRGDDAVYQSGDAMRIKVRTTADAYLLVYEIDTEGNVNLLFPWKRGRGFVEARHTLRLPADDSGYELAVGEQTGQGFLVAVASDQPFRELPWFLRPFDPQAASMGYEGAAGEPEVGEEGFDDRGRVVGDPYVAMERIRRRVVDSPGDLDGVASDYTTYYVHEVVRYPRYLCNDCHRPGYWAWWRGFDPYYAHCSTFDFRVNWSWYWGPHLWTSYVPYYYYVVRTDCPPRYQPWVGHRTRFSAWDGWGRWQDLSGGQLRRYKPAPAPAGYTPPPPRGVAWKPGKTPPGFVPPDVRRQTGSAGGGMRDWVNRGGKPDRPVIKGRGVQVEPGGRAKDGASPDRREGWDRSKPRTDGWIRPEAPKGRWVPRPASPGEKPEDRPTFRGRGSSGDSPRQPTPGDRPPSYERPRRDPPSQDRSPGYERPRRDPPSQDRPRYDPPRQDPPRQDPPRRDPPPSQEPSRSDPGYKQPQPQSDQPRWSPPRDRPDPPRGRGGKGGGN